MQKKDQMKETKIFIALVILAAIFIGCSEKPKKVVKDRSVGGTSEILLVTQNDEQWNGSIGQNVRAFFEEEQYGLPQPEKTFKVAHINIDALNDMFSKHRNLIIAEIVPELPNPVIESQPDWQASPQYAIKIKAKDAATWNKVFDSKKEELKQIFDKNERERLMNFYRPISNTEVIRQIKNKFGITMTVPNDFCIAVNREGFISVVKDAETKELIMDIIIYELPYKDDSDLSDASLLRVRDSIVKRYFEGENPGSFMTTDKEFVTPRYTVVPDFPAGYAKEMRGMWNMQKDFMAGPFVSYTIVNPTHDKLITAEGFVYYPNKEKRDYLRQLEAMIYSIRF